MNKHTPGPWEYRTTESDIGSDGDVYNEIWSKGPRGECLYMVKFGEYHPDFPLMAAAPQMLEALLDCRDSISAEFNRRCWELNFPKAEAAIKAAKGGNANGG